LPDRTVDETTALVAATDTLPRRPAWGIVATMNFRTSWVLAAVICAGCGDNTLWNRDAVSTLEIDSHSFAEQELQQMTLSVKTQTLQYTVREGNQQSVIVAHSYAVTDAEMDHLDAVFSDLTNTDKGPRVSTGGACGSDDTGYVLRITTATGTTQYTDSLGGCVAPFVDDAALDRAEAALFELVKDP
jgi:hypothetical protein